MEHKFYTRFIPLLLIIFLSLFNPAFAQYASISGKVIDEKGSSVSFATVQLEGTQYGSNTDDAGNYELNSVPPGSYTLKITYVGYADYTQPLTVGNSRQAINITMKADYLSLNEVVVVGYGTRQVRDLTGSVASVSSTDFQKGNVSTPEQLILGKVPGIEITSTGGAPGAANRIRIRGGASLNASNDPLIVIDGVPVDNTTKSDGTSSISGSANPLNLINPNEIENITVLKDASAAAIYGSRAANGVIIITTKKGASNSRFGIQFNSNSSVSHWTNLVPVFSAEELRNLINAGGNEKQISFLGDASTNWQKEIYRTGFSADNNLTFTGGIKFLPYRLTAGFLHNEGILQRSQLERTSVSLNLSPSFLQDHLKIELNSKFGYTSNFFTDQGAIGSAITFNPTEPVYSGNNFYGGYFEWLDPVTLQPNVLAPKNPVGLIYQKDDKSNVYRFIGNLNVNYKFHFLPELKANLNLGTDLSRSNGTVLVPDSAASSFYSHGSSTRYKQEKDNKLLEFYLNYAKDLKSIYSNIDFTAGYSYQDFITSNPSYASLNALGDTVTPAGIPFKTQNTLISFYGRLNYTLLDRYLLTLTLRDDGSSRFSPSNRWGLFPSAALAWRISDESFFKNSAVLSNLKLRLGYGVTGQQDIFVDYPYIANYQQGTSTAQYQFGDQFYYVLRPDGFDANIKWEQTVTYNAGLDFGFGKGRINGSVDLYDKRTSDLLAIIPIPAGTNFTNNILTNVGNLKNRGVEVALNFVPSDSRNFTWEIGGNATFNKNEITKLTKVKDSTDIGILVGGISGTGIGNTIQIQSVGYAINTFYVYRQKYNADGTPVIPTGNAATDTLAFVDKNHDGKITPDDRFQLKNPEPKVYLGFYSNFNYKNWSAGIQLRAELGNYVYNNVNSTNGDSANFDVSKNYLNNVVENYNETHFRKALISQIESDYYLEKASFLRCDNINLGYEFRNIVKNGSLRISAIVQNVFVISKYSGLDPEASGGIDNNIYPRPRIFSLNFLLNL
ncbi:MAG: SusC/RagA family TonB-linked outer membrane protein [Chitinophagales bacterium]|nr:SusC/RagA family TonB-linked outer membrane protein [Chitinophagales bacterium]